MHIDTIKKALFKNSNILVEETKKEIAEIFSDTIEEIVSKNKKVSRLILVIFLKNENFSISEKFAYLKVVQLLEYDSNKVLKDIEETKKYII